MKFQYTLLLAIGLFIIHTESVKMFGLGPLEILVILAAFVIFVGPDKSQKLQSN